MLFSRKISKTCIDQLENKTAILDFGTLQKVTTLLQKLFRTLRRTHLPYLWRPCFLTNHGKMSLPQMLPTKFQFIWLSGFRGEDVQLLINQKQELPMAAMCVNGSRRNYQSLQKTFHRCFLPSFNSFRRAVSKEKLYKNRPIRNKNCLWPPFFFTDYDKMSKLYKGPSIDAFYQVSDHLAKRFQRRRFFQKSTNQKQELSVAAMYFNGSR